MYHKLERSTLVCFLLIDNDCVIIEETNSDSRGIAFERPPPKYTEEAILDILLDRNIDSSVCGIWPVDIESSSTFVINISS